MHSRLPTGGSAPSALAVKAKRRKGKGGRPKGKPLSEVERAQRKAASWKHGKYASSALRQAVPPCRQDLCPLEGGPAADATTAPHGYPCTIKQDMDRQRRGLEVCPVALTANPTLRDAVRKALDGDVDGLKDHTADALSAMFGLEQQELRLIVGEGLVVKRPMYSKDGELIDQVDVVNPRAAPLFELTKQLGHTAADQAITPKSAGERQRDTGLGAMTAVLSRRAALREAGAGSAA